jgi:hypothetical protein
MDDDDANLRDYDAKLHVGGLEIASIEEDHVPSELLSVFTDEMYRSRACEFAAPGPVIADRLDILGFRPARVRETLDGVLDEHRRITDLARQYAPDKSIIVSRDLCEVAGLLTPAELQFSAAVGAV